MAFTLENELAFLLAAHEDPVSLVESDQQAFHAAQQGSFAAMVEQMRVRGQVTVEDRYDEPSTRTYAVAYITPEGRTYMNQLIAQGLIPAKDNWIG